MAQQNGAGGPNSSLEVRERLVEALKLDLVGPWAGHELAEERLPGWVRPSNWYLTGFLIPSGTPPEKSADADEDDELGEIPEVAGLAEESTEERRAAKKGFFPSSTGLSFLVPREAAGLAVGGLRDPVVHGVPGAGGLQLLVLERQVAAEDLEGHIPHGTRSVSVFLVNHREPDADDPDLAYAFQTEIEVRCERSFVPRPDLRGARAEDWDERVADLHYVDTPGYATGHGVSARWEIVDGACHRLGTSWIPSAEVEKTATVDVPGVELSMEALGALGDGAAADVTSHLRGLIERNLLRPLPMT
jgi:hypothetical protein